MTAQAPTYDLVLLLDPEAEEATRAKHVSEARKAIEARGELVRHDQWGNRALSYPINRRAAAEYHLLQFHASTPELLSALDRSLRIADEVLRFRIVKLEPGVPPAPEMRSAPPSARRGEPETQGEQRAEPPSEQVTSEQAAPAQSAPAQAAAEPPPAQADSEPPAPAQAAAEPPPAQADAEPPPAQADAEQAAPAQEPE